MSKSKNDAAAIAAHIVQPDVLVGEKALTLCGIKWLVETEWEDIDPGYPICRDCVDALVVAANEVNAVLAETFESLIDLRRGISLTTLLADSETAMSRAINASDAYAEARAAKAAAKAAKKRAKAAAKAAREGNDDAPVAPPEEQG